MLLFVYFKHLFNKCCSLYIFKIEQNNYNINFKMNKKIVTKRFCIPFDVNYDKILHWNPHGIMINYNNNCQIIKDVNKSENILNNKLLNHMIYDHSDGNLVHSGYHEYMAGNTFDGCIYLFRTLFPQVHMCFKYFKGKNISSIVMNHHHMYVAISEIDKNCIYKISLKSLDHPESHFVVHTTNDNISSIHLWRDNIVIINNYYDITIKNSNGNLHTFTAENRFSTSACFNKKIGDYVVSQIYDGMSDKSFIRIINLDDKISYLTTDFTTINDYETHVYLNKGNIYYNNDNKLYKFNIAKKTNELIFHMYDHNIISPFYMNYNKLEFFTYKGKNQIYKQLIEI